MNERDRRSLDKLAQRIERTLNLVPNDPEGSLYRTPIGGWSLLETYVNGWDSLHVHLWVVGSDRPHLTDSPDYCAVFEWPAWAPPEDRKRVLKDLRRYLRLGPRMAGVPLGEAGQDFLQRADPQLRERQMAVLVDAPEFIEHRELVATWPALPTYKRLEPFHRCVDALIDEAEVAPKGRGPVRPLADDWPANLAPLLGFRRGQWRVGHAQVPDHRVQGRPKVVDDIADEQPDRLCGDRLDDPRSDHDLSRVDGRGKDDLIHEAGHPGRDIRRGREIWDGLLVYLGPEGVRATLSEAAECAVQRFEVHIRPSDTREAILDRRWLRAHVHRPGRTPRRLDDA